jgi:hypothetical protein
MSFLDKIIDPFNLTGIKDKVKLPKPVSGTFAVFA